MRSVLESGGEVDVIIALVEPAGYGDPGSDPDRVRTEIARVQAEVLRALTAEDFRERRRFGSVPAVAGTLLTERGLGILLSHPYVRRIDRDLGGTGLGPPP